MFCQKQDALRDAAGHNLSRGGAMRTNLLALAVASALMLTQASVYAVEPVDPAAAPQVVPSVSVSAPDSAAPTEISSDAVSADTATAATEVGASVAPTEVTTDADAANAAGAAGAAEAGTGLFADAVPQFEDPQPPVGDKVEPLPQGLVFLMAEAQRGSVDAQVLLARSLEVGPQKDLKTAFHWWQQAAIAHDPRAELELSHYFAQGRVVDQDLKQSLYWLERSALGGNASAQLLLAMNYKAGQCCPQNAQLAAYWFEQAAVSGSGVAQAQIAYCYERGIGVPVDRQKAFYWHQFAGTHDANTASKLYVGQALKEASGVSSDYYLSYSWLSEAVEEGEPLAQVLLGNMYAHGQGVAEDDSIAVSLYQQAAAKNNAIAQYQLGLAFYTGKGIEPDRYQAKIYLERACAQGLSDACRFADEELADAPTLIAP